jgi:hypothetical protein
MKKSKKNCNNCRHKNPGVHYPCFGCKRCKAHRSFYKENPDTVYEDRWEPLLSEQREERKKRKTKQYHINARIQFVLSLKGLTIQESLDQLQLIKTQILSNRVL